MKPDFTLRIKGLTERQTIINSLLLEGYRIGLRNDGDVYLIDLYVPEQENEQLVKKPSKNKDKPLTDSTGPLESIHDQIKKIIGDSMPSEPVKKIKPSPYLGIPNDHIQTFLPSEDAGPHIFFYSTDSNGFNLSDFLKSQGE